MVQFYCVNKQYQKKQFQPIANAYVQIITLETCMNIDFYSEDELRLRFADEEQVRTQGRPLLNHYTPVENSNINFYDLLDVDKSTNLSQHSQSKFFDKKNVKHEKSSTIYLKESLGNLKPRRKTVLRNAPFQLMKNIQNIVIPGNNQELVQLFLKSDYFIWFIRVIAIINLIGIFLIDYSFRIHNIQSSNKGQEAAHSKHTLQIVHELSTNNIISLSLQLFTNCVFTFQILLRLYQNSQNIKCPYLIVNVIGTATCWATILFDMIENDSSWMFRAFMMVRIVRAIVRILQVFSFIRTPFEIFMKTIPSLKKLFFPLVILMLFYAIIGIALFSGANKYRCAETNEEGITTYTTNCGASLYTCPKHQHCAYVQNQADRGLELLQNQYNLVNFDNIGGALFTMYHFIYNTNFSMVRGKFTYYVNPYISSLFFISSSIIFYYIFANLIMVSMSKAYIEEIQSKTVKEEKFELEHEEERPQTFSASVIQAINSVVIVVNTIALCCIYRGIGQTEFKIQALADFVFLWISWLILIIKMFMERGNFKKNEFNIIDLFTLGAHIIGIINCGVMGNDIIYSTDKYLVVLRSLKVIRIIRLLYLSPSIFTYQKYVIKVFVQTLNKVKFFIVLCLCFVFMFKQLGELLFAYEVRLHAQHDQSVPYIKNFQGFMPSFYSILYLFYNQTWSETMYEYYKYVGVNAIVFYCIVAFVAFLMLMRLYIAVFLCYFKAELHKKEKKQLIHQKSANLDMKESYHSSDKKAGQQNKKIQESQRVEKSRNFIVTFLSVVYRSQYFDYLINGSIFVQSVAIIFKQAQNTPYQVDFCDVVQNACFVCYIIQVAFGCLADGFQVFFKKSKSNIISFVNVFIIVAALIPYGNFIINNYFRRITIIKIFTIFRHADKEMTIIIDSIFVICKNFFNFIFIYIFFLMIVALIPLICFYDTEPFHICTLQQVKNDAATFLTEQQCHLEGGVWGVPNQQFSHIFQAIAFMYQVIATETWTMYLQSLWYKNDNLTWEFYFTMAFFVYNICFLGIFLGFIVETYLQLKDKAYNLNKLKRSQTGWILIKNRINALFPKSILSIDPNSSPKRKFIFGMVTHQFYQIFFDYLAYFNAFLYLITFEDQSGLYDEVLNFLKKLFCAMFLVDTMLMAYGLRWDMFKYDNAVLECLGSVYIAIYWGFYLFSVPNNEEGHILEFLLVVLLLIRCKSLLLKYSWCKTNLNSVIDILPKCGNIIKLVCVFLFFYASIGLQIFKYVKPDNLVDNYNLGFNNILTAMLTLIRVVVAQAWPTVLSAFIKNSTEENLCFHIKSEEDAVNYGHMGCGIWVAYPYFLSFHIIMVLLILNLLIATMASAYDENYEIQYNSINIFQLEDCLSLWQKYDPQGTGVVQYKSFWRLTSQIAILFGISKKKLIKRKNKFFEELDLQIYQHKQNPILCYRFHDVITKFSKIKLQIANLGSEDDQTAPNKQFEISFDISPAVLSEIKDYIIPFPEQYYEDYRPFKGYKSGQTKYIFGLLKKMRQWKHSSTEQKPMVSLTKLSSIFDLKSKKLEADQAINTEQQIIDPIV